MAQPWPTMSIGRHAKISHDEVRRSGPPSDPIPFPPVVLRRARRDAAVVIIEDDGVPKFQPVYFASQHRAYRTIRHLGSDSGGSLARNGDMWLCQALHPVQLEGRDEVAFRIPQDGGRVVVKEIDKRRPGAQEAGMREAEAMNFVRSDNNAHVISSTEAHEDERFIYIVMPFCEGGDIFSSIWCPQLREHSLETGPEREAVVRYYFRQMLECVHYLQSIGVCHADISPENIMIRKGRCVLIDLDTALRVPTANGDPHRRVLVKPRSLSAKRPYMAPEIFLSCLPNDIKLRCVLRGVAIPNPPPFDAFAADRWTLGTTLYVMLTADYDKLYDIPFAPLDKRYDALICQRNLADVLSQGEITGFPLSTEAVDLLDKMLKPDPAARLTLEQVIQHPWVCKSDVIVPQE